LNDKSVIPEKIHIVGIGGAATSGLAMMLMERGHTVSGSDQNDDQAERFREAGIHFHHGHAARSLDEDTQLGIRNQAIPDDNPEIVEARRLDIEVLLYSEILGRLSSGGHAIAVAGTHGKTSTTGILTSIMIAAGRDPSVIVGGELQSIGGRNWRTGKGDDFIVEACEYKKSFLNLQPSCGIITNIEVDHPEIYCDLDAVQETFGTFLEGFSPGAPVVIPDSLVPRLRGVGQVKLIEFGHGSGPGWRATVIEKGWSPLVRFTEDGQTRIEVRLAMPGKHTRLNVTAAVALASALGVDLDKISTGIENYQGVKRRLERRHVIEGVEWFDDYAHHPTEVAMTLDAVREVYPNKKIWALFQPHQAQRLTFFLDEFSRAFDGFDQVCLLPIYHAREAREDFPEDLLNQLVVKLQVRGVCARTMEFEETIEEIPSLVDRGDVVVALGAGDIDKVGKQILEGATI